MTKDEALKPEQELFVVKHYSSDERPTIKGNGFDGLEIGTDREDAEEFIAWVNARISTPPQREPEQEPVAWMREEEDCSDCIVWEQTEEHTIPLYTAPPQREPEQEYDDLTIAYLSGFYDGANKYAPQRNPEVE